MRRNAVIKLVQLRKGDFYRIVTSAVENMALRLRKMVRLAVEGRLANHVCCGSKVTARHVARLLDRQGQTTIRATDQKASTRDPASPLTI
jgi:hypothetical protein